MAYMLPSIAAVKGNPFSFSSTITNPSHVQPTLIRLESIRATTILVHFTPP